MGFLYSWCTTCGMKTQMKASFKNAYEKGCCTHYTETLIYAIRVEGRESIHKDVQLLSFKFAKTYSHFFFR